MNSEKNRGFEKLNLELNQIWNIKYIKCIMFK